MADAKCPKVKCTKAKLPRCTNAKFANAQCSNKCTNSHQIKHKNAKYIVPSTNCQIPHVQMHKCTNAHMNIFT